MTTMTNPNKALWEKGDFTRIAATMRPSGEAFVRRLGVTAGLEVLDLGCGDGTTAIPAAQAGANSARRRHRSNLVAAGRARAGSRASPTAPSSRATHRTWWACRTARSIFW